MAEKHFRNDDIWKLCIRLSVCQLHAEFSIQYCTTKESNIFSVSSAISEQKMHPIFSDEKFAYNVNGLCIHLQLYLTSHKNRKHRNNVWTLKRIFAWNIDIEIPRHAMLRTTLFSDTIVNCVTNRSLLKRRKIGEQSLKYSIWYCGLRALSCNKRYLTAELCSSTLSVYTYSWIVGLHTVCHESIA